MTTQNTETAPVTVNAILDRYERDGMDDLMPRTRKNYLYHIVELRKAFGGRIAQELRPRDFGPFLDVKRGRCYRVRSLAVLSSALTKAVSSWYLIDRNVLRDVKRPTFSPRDRLISDDEFTRLRALAPERIQIAMDLALITGQRQSDILSFKWADIKDGFLHLQQSKTGKRLAIELTKDLKRILGRCAGLSGQPSEYVLPTRMGRPFTPEGFRSAWQRVHRKWLKSGGEPLHFHDIRALAATRCPTLEYAQALLGHSSPAMTRRVYRRGVERVTPLSLS